MAFNAALHHVETLNQYAVSATSSLAEVRRNLAKPLNEEGIPADEVLCDLIRDTQGGLLRNPGGRFFAWAIGGSVPAALGADWLTSAWDQNAAIHTCGPAAAVVEEIAGAWLKELLGLPTSASFAFVTGSQMAHVTCLAAARHSLLQARGWDVERKGLAGSPPIRILASNRHGSIDRAIRILGLGEDNLASLPADLESTLAASPDTPTIVILQCGDLNTGAFDDYRTLIPIAKKHNAWVHIDGAFGLWVAASAAKRHLVSGIDSADSWVTDGHKWLNVPYDSGYAFVAHPDAHAAALSYRAPYLVHDQDARDQIDWNPEWSRRARGFSTYAAIRQLGRNGIASLIDRCCHYAAGLVEGIGSLPGAQIVSPAYINQGLVRFLDPKPFATEEDHDRFTDAIIQQILKGREVFFLGTTWQGRRAMRISVLNWQTTKYDIEVAVSSVLKSIAALTALRSSGASNE